MQTQTLTKLSNVNKIIREIKKGDTGYLYVMSNSIEPNWLKIGMTRRIPHARLHEANHSNLTTWTLPLPYKKYKAFYKIEYAKLVACPHQKEKTLHLLLHNKRINANKEFFEITLNELMPYFSLIDGEDWTRTRQYFAHGQSIRSIIGEDVWVGTYDLGKNTIVCNGVTYMGCCPLTKFANAHGKKHNIKDIHAWKHCESFINGQWVSTDKLKECEQYWMDE